MCGRYYFVPPGDMLAEQTAVFDAWDKPIADLLMQREPQYNVAPSQRAPVILHGNHGITVGAFIWGLVPSWSRDGKAGYSTINARVESVQTSRLYATPFKTKRCLIPAAGYYEWKGAKGSKQPYSIHARDSRLLMFAGLWELWHGGQEEAKYTYTVITEKPGLVSGEIHDRQPAILPASCWNAWLTGDAADAADILESLPDADLTYYPVSKAVGNVRNNGQQLIEPIEL